jgi:DNA modification methylase
MTTHQPPEPSIPDGYLYRQYGPAQLYLGDAAQVLAAMPDDSVDCVVTSPPFWGLRDYGTGAWHGGDPACQHRLGRTRRTDQVTCPACQARWVDPQYGLEGSLDDYLDHLVAVFDQARRVLAPTGTCWVNLGDSYSAGTRLAYDTTGGITGSRQLPQGRRPAPLPAKNLLGVPWRAAFAIQSSGWILRNAVVWAKSNPMPESVRDRLSATYELLFLFAKSPRYFFDLDPIRIPLAWPGAADGTRVIGGIHKGRTAGVDATRRRRGSSGYGANKHAGELAAGAGSGNLRPVGHAHTAAHPGGRNPGDVWRLATRPYRGAHVAPFPVDLPLRAIAAGCPEGGLVVDPFCGAGTTGLAALQLGRRFAGIDVSAAFLDETLTRLSPHLPDLGQVAG